MSSDLRLASGRTVAGGIAGAAAIAAGTSAYAAVLAIPLPADVTMPAAGTTNPTTGGFNWDANGDSIADFAFAYRFPNTATGSGVVWQANMNPVNGTTVGNAVLGFAGPFISYAVNAPLNTVVGPTTPSTTTFRTTAQVTLGSVYRSGGVPSAYGGFSPGAAGLPAGFPAAATGYVGFRVGQGATAQYGWLQVAVTAGGAGVNGITFLGGAIETTPNTPIAAGVIPEPGSLAALACGAVALLRRKSKASLN
jgi:hypothetical protein